MTDYIEDNQSNLREVPTRESSPGLMKSSERSIIRAKVCRFLDTFLGVYHRSC